MTYKGIIGKFAESTGRTIYDRDVVTCMINSALGFVWNKASNKAGRRPYLCPEDTKKLSESSLAIAHEADGTLDPAAFIDLAVDIKTARLTKAALFLWKIGCKKLAVSLKDEETVEPTRSWVNEEVKKIGMQLQSPLYIDSDRINTGYLGKLIPFYENNEEIITQCPIPLMFGADETMLDTTLRGKLIVDIVDPHPILRRDPLKIPHVTSMCCHTATGVALPPFIILPKLSNLPAELSEFSQSGQAWFASSQSGWMCRDLFLIWVIHFINWLSSYRLTLNSHIRNAAALLILDGHSSRECPIALALLKSSNCNVLVLPGHTTHITQMFDVCIASALKAHYTKILNKLLKESIIAIENKSAKARYCAVRAFITAWQKVCTHDACIRAAKKTGLYPFNPRAVANSPFVREGDAPEEAARRVTRLEIGGKVITEPVMINAIARMLGSCPQFAHLCLVPRAGLTYCQYIKEICKPVLRNGCAFLGRLPCYVDRDKKVVTFD